jgi:hypothetical protein
MLIAQYRHHRRPALDGIILPEQSSFRFAAGDQRRVSKPVIDGEKKPAPNLRRLTLQKLSQIQCTKFKHF